MTSPKDQSASCPKCGVEKCRCWVVNGASEPVLMFPDGPFMVENITIDGFRMRNILRRKGSRMTPEQAAAEAYALEYTEEHHYTSEPETIITAQDAFASGFYGGVVWAREHDEGSGFNYQRNRVAELEAQVANWEREEVRKASCCADNEERVKELEAELARLQVYIRDNHASKAMADDNRQLRDQLADLTGGLSVEEFKRLFLEMQKNIAETIAALSDE
jgi:hypothetical protein